MHRAADAAAEAAREGLPETEIAHHLGVNRMTVRRWLGKL
jgi:transposase